MWQQPILPPAVVCWLRGAPPRAPVASGAGEPPPLLGAEHWAVASAAVLSRLRLLSFSRLEIETKRLPGFLLGGAAHSTAFPLAIPMRCPPRPPAARPAGCWRDRGAGAGGVGG